MGRGLAVAPGTRLATSWEALGQRGANPIPRSAHHPAVRPQEEVGIKPTGPAMAGAAIVPITG